MLSNMSASLIEHETIRTTVVKAKELRRFVEPLITLSKVDSVANRRRAFAKLRSKKAVGKLFSELGPRYVNRPGGYTRILKAGYRRGDSAMVAYMQLVGTDLMVDDSDSEPEPEKRAVEQISEGTATTEKEEATDTDPEESEASKADETKS